MKQLTTSERKRRTPCAVWWRLSVLASAMIFSGVTRISWAQTISFNEVSDRASIAVNGSARGAAVHDFDRDGWDDVFVAVSQGTSALFRNNQDGTFTDVAEAAGVNVVGRHTVALWGDVDNDGLADLFVGRTISGTNRLFRNRGDGTFEDITTGAGIDPVADVATAAFGDYDGDGAIDLFLAIDRAPDILYRNTSQSGTVLFEDVSDRAGIVGNGASVPMQATWIDYDRDGDLDLFCVHDSRTPSRLYKNSGFLPWSNVGSSAGIDTYPTETTCCNMGTAWGDFDGDGFLDAYVTRIGTGGLYRNNGDGTFEDVADAVGADRNGMSWGVVFSDFDNDADLDLFVVSTSGYDGTPTLLYRNDNGAFEEIGSQAGVSRLMEAQGLATGDFNNDGLVDIFIPSHDGNNRLFENAAQDAGHWIELSLEGVSTNSMSIGTRVEAQVDGKVLIRVVSGGDSYASQSSTRLHIGLGAADRVDTLRVFWNGSAAEEVTNLDADARYSFSQGQATDREVVQTEPTEWLVSQNYPNPFEHSTTINYVVPRNSLVRLDVYDVLGRRVAELVNEYQLEGSRFVSFEAIGLPAGTYVYRLSTIDGVHVRAMTRTK